MSARFGDSQRLTISGVTLDASKVSIIARVFVETDAAGDFNFIEATSGGAFTWQRTSGGNINPLYSIAGGTGTGSASWGTSMATNAWHNPVWRADRSLGSTRDLQNDFWLAGSEQGAPGGSPGDWDGFVGAFVTTARDLVIDQVASGAQFRLLDLTILCDHTITGGEVTSFNGGSNPKAIWPIAKMKLYQRLDTGVNQAGDIGTVTNTGVTLSGTGDPTTDGPPSDGVGYDKIRQSPHRFSGSPMYFYGG